jgi:hypothetical protein
MSTPITPASKFIPSNRLIAFHEASHAAAMVLVSAGMPPLYVRVDGPLPDGATGVMKTDLMCAVTPSVIRALVIGCLQGPLTEGFQIPIGCPVDVSTRPEEVQPDGVKAARLAEFLNVDGLEWMRLTYEAGKQASDSKFRKLTTAIADELERVGAVVQYEVIALAAELGEQ